MMVAVGLFPVTGQPLPLVSKGGTSTPVSYTHLYKWFQVFPVFLYPISLVLLAFVTLMGIITGDRVNGAARWMTFMGLQFQPSELAKMAVIIAVSFILSKRQDEEGANPKAFKYIMILTGLVLLLIAPENLSTAMRCV